MMKLTVYVFCRPNMFNVNENMYNMIGLGELKSLFTDPNYKSTGLHLQLYYPERFLNTLEQRALIDRLYKADYSSVELVTHSEHILCTVDHKNILVVQDELIPEGVFKLSNDASGMPDDGGLGVIMGSL